MPRTISAALQTHLEGEVTTLALCWKIQRRDGTQYHLTNHDEIITHIVTPYTPIGAGGISTYRQTSNLNADNIDLRMVFSAASGRDAELRAGLFDYAEVWTFRINWADTSMGRIMLAYGRLGEVVIRDNEATIELRSLTQLLATNIGRIYTPECDATLGDARCKIDIAAFTKAGETVVITDNRVFTITGAASGQIDKYYNYGKIYFSSGLNAGITLQIENYASATNTITLIEPAPYTIVGGTFFTATGGCNRQFETCKSRFGNKDNFRGFPHIPGMDKALMVPANQKWTEGN